MRIGFDAKRAVLNNTGLGNYSRYIVEILSSFYPDNEYRLYSPKEKNNARLQELQSRTNVSFVYPKNFFDKTLSSLWRTQNIVTDLKADKIDLFHGLSNEIPLRIQSTNIKSVVSLHDLIFLRYPELYKAIDRKIYTRKFRYACEHSDTVIAISECTKRDIIDFFGIDEAKIKVVYQGCDQSFAQKVSEEQKQAVSKKFNLPEKFILNVGSIETRKNLLLAIQALKNLAPDIHLVAVGKATPYMTELTQYIEKQKLEKRVHFYHQVTFADLPSFYQLAQVFVYPSVFEGFGIPIIEALSSGIPVVAATGSCLEEAGGKHSIYVSPTNDMGMSEAINSILSDETLYQTMRAEGMTYVKRFEDKQIASDVMRVYAHLLPNY